jgi:anti-sigma regulatory factor (Ser/Thr protein kinase)
MTGTAGSYRCRLENPSYVGEARRAAVRLGEGIGMDATEIGQFSIIVTELGTNLVKHAGGGELIIRRLRRQGRHGLEVISLDKGPGIVDIERSLGDGYSTAGSPGTGLGAVVRLATLFDIYSVRGSGTAILARLHSRRQGSAKPSAESEIGAVSVAAPGEEVSGDAWAFEEQPDWAALLVVDGLGHGPMAGAAAAEAVAIFLARCEPAPAPLMESIHNGIRHTRGAAAAIASLLPREQTIKFCGVGNITAAVVNGSHVKRTLSHNGIVGYEIRRIQELEYAWPEGSLLIMHSDGLTAHWDFEKYPGLQSRHPGLIAGVLFRDCLRGRDDATVVVVKNSRKAE